MPSRVVRDSQACQVFRQMRGLINQIRYTEQDEGISYLLETFKHLFPHRNLNTKTIWQR